jgi:hypothetical protein
MDMKHSPEMRKAGFVAVAIAALALAGLAADKVTDAAKAYQSELETMMSQAPMTLIAKIEGWQFVRSDAWKEDNPTAKVIGKHRMGKAKFSKREIKDIFAEPGQYKIALYSKLVGTSSATRGTIDEMGLSNSKDATVTLKVFTVIRMVFKNEKLVDVRTWPKLEGSTMSGGNAWSVW